ncbi:MAG: GlmU family protein [Chitinophagales bacterium]
MAVVLFDLLKNRKELLPLTHTRPVADCRWGITSLREKWERQSGASTLTLSEGYLSGKFPFPSSAEKHVYVNGSVWPDAALWQAIEALPEDTLLVHERLPVAFISARRQLNFDNLEALAHGFAQQEYRGSLKRLQQVHQLFSENGWAIRADMESLTEGRKSAPLSDSNRVIGDASLIFVEPGAVAEGAIFNTKSGPIYLGAESEVMEGSMIRGPFALCDHGGVKMGAKIYGPTTIGPHCKVGGEISNSVLFGYSNKGHDGFIGNTVIGEWCNLGADTNTSNLKNNYGDVDVWSYVDGGYRETGLQFHGMIMGDHAKSGINTMFNTGTVVGVSANVFGGDFPPKFIPGFSWGGAKWLRTFQFEKALEVAQRMMERRGLVLSDGEIAILKEVYEREAQYRK